jgi:hypothetical protein
LVVFFLSSTFIISPSLYSNERLSTLIELNFEHEIPEYEKDFENEKDEFIHKYLFVCLLMNIEIRAPFNKPDFHQNPILEVLSPPPDLG